MKFERSKLYDESKCFFELAGDSVMKLTHKAAIDVCIAAADRSLVIARVEGGIFSGNSYEARLDAIWDGKDPPLSYDETRKNNARAIEFIKMESAVHNAFIITCAPIFGWSNNKSATLK